MFFSDAFGCFPFISDSFDCFLNSFKFTVRNLQDFVRFSVVFRSFQILSDPCRLFQILLDSSRFLQIFVDSPRLFQIRSDSFILLQIFYIFFRLSQIPSDSVRFYQILSDSLRFSQILPNSLTFRQIFSNFFRFSEILSDFFDSDRSLLILSDFFRFFVSHLFSDSFKIRLDSLKSPEIFLDSFRSFLILLILSDFLLHLLPDLLRFFQVNLDSSRFAWISSFSLRFFFRILSYFFEVFQTPSDDSRCFCVLSVCFTIFQIHRQESSRYFQFFQLYSDRFRFFQILSDPYRFPNSYKFFQIPLDFCRLF